MKDVMNSENEGKIEVSKTILVLFWSIKNSHRTQKAHSGSIIAETNCGLVWRKEWAGHVECFTVTDRHLSAGSWVWRSSSKEWTGSISFGICGYKKMPYYCILLKIWWQVIWNSLGEYKTEIVIICNELFFFHISFSAVYFWNTIKIWL